MTRLRLAGLVLVGIAVLVGIGSMIAQWVGGGGSAATGGAGTASPGERVRVQVLNAARVPGLARSATRDLRDAGFDVVYFGNADTGASDTSVVLDRVGRPELAQDVARALDISRVYTRRDSSLYLEVTVILGRDWARIPADSAN